MVQDVGRFDPKQVTREAFAAWASQQDPDEEYEYTQPHACALCQFIEFLSGSEVSVDPYTFSVNGGTHEYPRDLDRAARQEPNTFGALAERLAEQASA